MFVENILDESLSVLEQFKKSRANLDSITQASEALIQTFQNKKRVYSCGNGGSMSDAMHFAEELSARFIKNRKPLPATAISDPAYMSCVANDFGYDFIFSRYLDAMLEKGDVLLVISTSGNSQNVINAVNVAKEKGGYVIGLLGKDGGKLKDIVDCSIIVKSNTTARIQEIHIKIIHTLVELVERKLFPENY